MINGIAKRFNEIAQGVATDASDEYYTLHHSFMALFLELLCRYNAGIKYKVIICPCDSATSIFRELPKYADLIGNPQIIYSFYPEKDWADYFDMDYEAEYGCKPDEVCIFTNLPFKGLSSVLKSIKCDFLIFGSNAVGFSKGTYCLLTKSCKYIKNNETFDGSADNFSQNLFGAVRTCFYSNMPFLSFGEQYTSSRDTLESILFGKDKLIRVDQQKGA